MGGSPAAKPISLCAMANRVRESTTSRTFFPCAQKYSATAVADSACSDPQQRRTGPKLKRPRRNACAPPAPASQENLPLRGRVLRPGRQHGHVSSRTLEPSSQSTCSYRRRSLQKSPKRCPRPQVRKPSTAANPASQRLADRGPVQRRGARPSTSFDFVARYSPSRNPAAPPVASITLPSISGPTRSDGRAPHVII